VRPDGAIRRIEARAFPVYDGAGVYVRITGVCEDITERKAAEDQIAYLSRVHGVLSGINSLIVRVTDTAELLTEACHIAVEAGGFRVAWIDLVDTHTTQITLAASAGTDDVLVRIFNERFDWSLVEAGYRRAAHCGERVGNPVATSGFRHVDARRVVARRGFSWLARD